MITFPLHRRWTHDIRQWSGCQEWEVKGFKVKSERWGLVQGQGW